MPVILAFAVSIAYNIHIHSFFRKNMMLTGKRKESVLYAMKETGWSVLFSGLTTIVALLSFLSVMLKPIRSVGILSSIAVGFILLVALTVSPILLSFGKGYNQTDLTKHFSHHHQNQYMPPEPHE